jgi:hypothetical protein
MSLDADALISRLACPLSSLAREAFRQAAQAALTQLAYRGEGIDFRTVAPLQRSFFEPPDEYRARWDIIGELGEMARSRSIHAEPPIGEDGPGARYRRIRAAG